MARTLQDKLLLALLSRGEREIKRLTGCIVVSRSNPNSNKDSAVVSYYYIGRNGSLRYGATRAGSFPASRSLKQELLAEEALIGKASSTGVAYNGH